MKLIIVIATLAVARSANLDRTYLPPPGDSNSDGSGLLETPKLSGSEKFGRNFDYNRKLDSEEAENNKIKGFDAGVSNDFNQNELEELSRPERPQAKYEKSADTIRGENENNGDAYSYLFETENGIFVEESGVAADGVQAQGGYSYTGDDGQVYSIRYTADENGFVPQGEHLPTAPPVPEEILRALEQNARDEAAGIFDDGSYDERKYNGDEYAQQYDQSYRGPGFQGPAGVEGSFSPQNDANTVATQAAAYLPPREFQRNQSNGNKTPVIESTNGLPRYMKAVENQAANFPQLSSNSRSRALQRLPALAESTPNGSSHSENLRRPSSYDVPLQSRIPEEILDASRGLGSRIQNGRSTRPSFNSRTGYKY